MNNIKKNIPWAWVPTLYFAQGIPYFIVNNISVLMFAKMGVPNGDMALFTSLLYLPWTIKPFWSPFVDIIRTKRWWVVSMQILMSIAFILLALTIPHPDEATMAAGTTPISMFTVTLILFIITAFASATHDIAADGFYMLALKSGEQAEFVGIRSTFYRLASIFGQGVLVAIAGAIELKYDNIPLSWTITMLVTAVMFSAVSFITFHDTQTVFRQIGLGSGNSRCQGYFQGVRTHFRHLFYQTGCTACHCIHAALPPARGIPHQDVHAFPRCR